MKKIRVGLFGVGRGTNLAECFMMQDAEIVAICDNRKERIEKAMGRLKGNIAVYENFDDFIDHPMDAVILANNFHQHAPYAIKCFERNIHVFSECIANGTMSEGVALIRAFEKRLFHPCASYKIVLFGCYCLFLSFCSHTEKVFIKEKNEHRFLSVRFIL